MKSRVTFEIKEDDLPGVLLSICEASPEKLSIAPVNGSKPGPKRKYKKRKSTLQKNKKV